MKLYQCPRWIVLQLLEQCNLKCKMCYEWGKNGAYGRENTARLEMPVLKRLVEDCCEYKPYYDLFGGEPLLYKDLDELLELLNYYECPVDIPTNGVLLKEKVESLLRNPPNRIWVSLDGPKDINDVQRGPGVYDAALEGIQVLLEKRAYLKSDKPYVGVSYIVTPYNYLYVESFFAELLEKQMLDQVSIELQLHSSVEQCIEYEKLLQNVFGVNKFYSSRGMLWNRKDFEGMNFAELATQIRKVRELCIKKNIFLIIYPQTIDADNYRHYFRGEYNSMLNVKKRCMMPWTYVEITAQGDVAPCHTYYDLSFGNIKDDKLLDIWNSEAYNRYREYMKKNMLPICTSCCRYFTYNTKRDMLS